MERSDLRSELFPLGDVGRGEPQGGVAHAGLGCAEGGDGTSADPVQDVRPVVHVAERIARGAVEVDGGQRFVVDAHVALDLDAAGRRIDDEHPDPAVHRGWDEEPRRHVRCGDDRLGAGQPPAGAIPKGCRRRKRRGEVVAGFESLR